MSLFDWAAPIFHRFADRWSEEHIADIAAKLSPYLGERRAVLDLGGGTGALAVRIAEAFPATVTVLDPSPKMVGYVPDHPRVSAIVGTAEAMPFDDGAFDVVVVSDAFHHFRNQDAAVREITRVTRTGGALFMLEFDNRGAMRLVVWGEKLLGEPGAFFAPGDLCEYLDARGIAGRCVPTSKRSYYFLGEMR